MGPVGVEKRLFNAEVLETTRATDPIYVCEGITDVLTAFQIGKPAVGILGATSFRPEWAAKFRKRDVHIVPDNDSAGHRMGEAMARMLAREGLSFVIQRLPFGKDLNDYMLGRDRRR